jgi:hypothetical protein
MEYIKPILENILSESKTSNDIFKRNLIKEYLQIFVLEFIYAHPRYSQLFFYGGSCLAHCFGLPRLSEDLDFVDKGKKINMDELANDLEKYFKENIDIGKNVEAKSQKFRVYLKFPVLYELGLSEGRKEDTDLLFLKVEVFSDFDFCEKHDTEIRPIFKFNRSVLIKTFDLSTLMASKIGAILERKWEKTDKTGKTLIKVKGRDYFDLMWYLEKGVKPNLKCIKSIKDMDDLRKKLLSIISKIDSSSIKLDLDAFINNEALVKNISSNLKDILVREIKEKI